MTTRLTMMSHQLSQMLQHPSFKDRLRLLARPQLPHLQPKRRHRRIQIQLIPLALHKLHKQRQPALSNCRVYEMIFDTQVTQPVQMDINFQPQASQLAESKLGTG